MRRKLSETKLVTGIACIIVSVIVLFNTTIITNPVVVAEKGIVYTAVSLTAMAYGIHLIKRSIQF